MVDDDVVVIVVVVIEIANLDRSRDRGRVESSIEGVGEGVSSLNNGRLSISEIGAEGCDAMRCDGTRSAVAGTRSIIDETYGDKEKVTEMRGG